jgi:hypothetical protein
MGFSRTNLICLFSLLVMMDHAEGAAREKRSRSRTRRPKATTPAGPNSGNNPQGRTVLPPQAPLQQPYVAPYPPPQQPYPPVGAPQYRRPPRQQNQFGQPAFIPPHLRNQDDFTGVKNWYYSTGATFGAENLTRSNPGIYECEKCKKTIEEPRWALQLQGAAGWGPVKRNNFSFTTHYRYTQNLRTNDEQVRRFGTWFSSFKASDFLFPTKDMLRSHELVTEIRYSKRPWQFGMHAMLEFERVGSSSLFLGEENEIADSVRNIEQIVPWVQWRKPGAYIGTLYSPMRTEINKEDPRTSFTSWSATTAGRGLFVSVIQDNLIYLPRISSTIGATLSWLNKKAASVQNDSTLLGIKTSMDFPIAYNIRTQPYLKYEVENYILERISMAQTEDAKTSLAERSDEVIGSGAQIYFDWSKSVRLNFTLSYESRQSSLSDFSSSRLVYQGGILYSWPLSRTVLKRIDRFSESLSSEEN